MDATQTGDKFGGTLTIQADEGEELRAEGTLTFEFTDSDGNVFRRDEFHNLVTTLGKNILLGTTLTGVAYTVTGPFMGLISSVGFSAVAAADTMASHAGWNEVLNSGTNTPPYGTVRPTLSFSAASGGVISTSAAAQYVFTNSGTVQGGFISLGTGAVATVGSTAGVLYSCGTLSAAQPVISTNTLNVSYSGTLT